MPNSSLELLAPYINLPHTHTSPSPVCHQIGFRDSSTYRAPTGKLENGDHSRKTNTQKIMKGSYVADFIPRPGRPLYQRSVEEKTIIKLSKVKAITKRICTV